MIKIILTLFSWTAFSQTVINIHSDYNRGLSYEFSENEVRINETLVSFIGEAYEPNYIKKYSAITGVMFEVPIEKIAGHDLVHNEGGFKSFKRESDLTVNLDMFLVHLEIYYRSQFHTENLELLNELLNIREDSRKGLVTVYLLTSTHQSMAYEFLKDFYLNYLKSRKEKI